MFFKLWFIGSAIAFIYLAWRWWNSKDIRTENQRLQSEIKVAGIKKAYEDKVNEEIPDNKSDMDTMFSKFSGKRNK